MLTHWSNVSLALTANPSKRSLLHSVRKPLHVARCLIMSCQPRGNKLACVIGKIIVQERKSPKMTTSSTGSDDLKTSSKWRHFRFSLLWVQHVLLILYHVNKSKRFIGWIYAVDLLNRYPSSFLFCTASLSVVLFKPLSRDSTIRPCYHPTYPCLIAALTGRSRVFTPKVMYTYIFVVEFRLWNQSPQTLNALSQAELSGIKH